jgi:hypothetical protein
MVTAYTSSQRYSPDVVKVCTRWGIQVEQDTKPLQSVSRSAQHRMHGWGILAEQWIVWMASESSNKEGTMKMNEDYSQPVVNELWSRREGATYKKKQAGWRPAWNPRAPFETKP